MDISTLVDFLGCSENRTSELLEEYGLSLDSITPSDMEELKIVLANGSAIAPVAAVSPVQTKTKAKASTKLAKGKPSKIAQSRQAEDLQSAFDPSIVIRDAAKAGYNSETFAVAGQAFLLGGRQRMIETISAGVSHFAIGAKEIFGSVDLTDTDVWGDMPDELNVETDVWG